MKDLKKTPAMLELEHRLGRPLEDDLRAKAKQNMSTQQIADAYIKSEYSVRTWMIHLGVYKARRYIRKKHAQIQ